MRKSSNYFNYLKYRGKALEHYFKSKDKRYNTELQTHYILEAIFFANIATGDAIQELMDKKYG